MKERKFLPASILVGSALILIGLIKLSNAIQNRPFAGTPSFPSSIEVSAKQPGEYMNEWEAISYLRMDSDHFFSLLRSGALDGTYFPLETVKQIPDSSETITGTIYIFSKHKLDEWMIEKIDSRN
ncbi:MAG: hypothetical protein FWG31_02995 [Oscillospiraceae bacterium]|nr:hypothetical protein [Oscillospiraceae bacterium]